MQPASPSASTAHQDLTVRAISQVTAQADPPVDVVPTTKRQAKVIWLGAASAGTLLACAGGWFVFGHSVLQITDVHGAQHHLIGDGRPQPITLEYEAKNTDVKAVEVRFVRGNGQWPSGSQTYRVDAAARAKGELTAGTITQRAENPINATFEYTLITRNGQRSEPFEQTFDIVPPVRITSARLVGTPRLNQPYTVQLGYQKGAADIVQVNRRVLDSSVPWSQPEVSLPVTLNQATGTYQVAMDAPTQPMRSTVAFEMVDSLGIKSEPATVAVNVAIQPMTFGPATVMSVVLVRGGGANSGVGALTGGVAGAALGSQIGRGSGRTAATLLGAIGGAFAGNQVEHQVRGPSLWETVVRFDDGNTRRVRHSDTPRWAAGQRVTVTRTGAVSL